MGMDWIHQAHRWCPLAI